MLISSQRNNVPWSSDCTGWHKVKPLHNRMTTEHFSAERNSFLNFAGSRRFIPQLAKISKRKTLLSQGPMGKQAPYASRIL